MAAAKMTIRKAAIHFRKMPFLTAFFSLRLSHFFLVVVQFGLRVGPVECEIPSASLRAGSSLRLKNGCAQDDSRPVIAKLHHYFSLFTSRFWAGLTWEPRSGSRRRA